MVFLTSPETSTMNMLIERLNWPVRMVRWRTAKEFGALLSSRDYSKQARDIYLDWLSSRQLESEIISGLTVLLCTQEDGLPSFKSLEESLSRPSILADILLQFVYGSGRTKGEWHEAHSETVPDSFVPEKYFDDHKSADVPPFLGIELQKLEQRTGLPFTRQWAFEWRTLMDETKSPYSSGYPYHFVNAATRRSGVHGQFSQRQCDVYRSAFLRTLACAVSCWGMPISRAARMSLNTLPINLGLVNIEPIQRPGWLSDIPEQCSHSDASLEQLTKKLIEASVGRAGMRPVSLRIPISTSIYEFADLSITAVLVTKDFSPEFDSEKSFRRVMPWISPDAISVNGPMEHEKIDKFTVEGVRGTLASLCVDIWPMPSGFWHNDYFQIGISLPAPYLFQHQAHVSCLKDHIEIICNGDCAGSWSVWHDHWTPLYPEGGDTRCGMLTELREADIADALKKHDMELAWVVDMRIWDRPSDYGDLKMIHRREFFRD